MGPFVEPAVIAPAGAAQQPTAGTRPRSYALIQIMPALILLGAFFVIPLARLFGLSIEGWRLDSYVRIWSEGIYIPVFLNTFKIAGIVTVLCLLIGYPVSLFLATTSKLWRTLGFVCVMFPLWTSVIVRTYAWMVILGRNGILNRTLLEWDLISSPIPFLNSQLAVIIGMVHVMLPFMILPVYSAATRIDPELPKAALGLGASRFRVFLEILLPLTLGGVVAGATLVFVVSIGFYITPALLGGGKVIMISNLIEQQVRELLAWDFASALSVVLLAVTLIVAWASKKSVSRWIPA